MSPLAAACSATAIDAARWYRDLDKPSWKPPDAAFAPVWTVIFACAGLSGAIAWRRAATETERRALVRGFSRNAVLNAGWSMLFFGAKRPDWALAETAPLWLSVAELVRLCGRRSKGAAALLAPYIVWVSFAAALNAEIVRRNAPFD